MSDPCLPSEIVDYIIDLLRDEPDALNGVASSLSYGLWHTPENTALIGRGDFTSNVDLKRDFSRSCQIARKVHPFIVGYLPNCLRCRRGEEWLDKGDIFKHCTVGSVQSYAKSHSHPI